MAYTPVRVTYGWDVYVNGRFYEFSAGYDQEMAHEFFFGRDHQYALACWYKDENGKHTYIPSQY